MRYSRLPLRELISFFLSQGKEGEFWDFKQEWHTNIEDLIKDIICFANTVHDENCYLIFGVADNLKLTGMSKVRRKQADVLDAISNLVFAGDNLPSISIETVEYEGVELDVLIIHDTYKTPIFLKKTYGKMKQGCIYARIGDRNTPDLGNAEIGVIENLWRKRLGLTKAPLEYIFDVLDNKLEWVASEYGYYNIYMPEYTIERTNNECDSKMWQGADEFYSYAQTNESTSYYMMEVKARGTTLERYQIMILDSGRLSVPVPEWDYIQLDEYYSDVIGYKYYISGSRTERLMRFMYEPQNSEQRWAFSKLERITLFFVSEDEKNCFEQYVDYNKSELKNRIDASSEFDYIVAENDVKTNGYKRSLRTALVLKEMLEEFRLCGKNLAN